MSTLIHSGVGHDENPPGPGSGRYPWGSGENPNQHQFSFNSEVNKLRKEGLTDAEIARSLLGQKGQKKDGTPIWYNTSDLRAEIAIQTSREKQAKISRALKLYDECNGNVSEVGRRMGINESSVRSLLKASLEERTSRYENTAEFLRQAVSEKGLIDVGKGIEYGLGITDSTKKVALAMLEKEGYVKTWVQVPTGPDHKTTVMVLAPPGTPWSEIQKNKLNVKPLQDYTPDEGKTWWTPEFPESLDSKRIYVRYGEDGGKDKDGVIELRRGVEDISLGGSQYSQVRIAVDGTHYMKGMAMYADDIPDGFDIIYNTNKSRGTPLIGVKDHEVLKRMKIDAETGEVDRDNPFGALIKSPKDGDGLVFAGGQRHYIDENGVERLSPINKLRDEGDWDSWSRNLASQFLSKQPLKLINQQIDMTLKSKKVELEEIEKLTNPVIKQKMLDDFASNCDSNAADLSVRGFKNQAFQVLLPITSLKDNEIYAPNYQDGDTVALVRYPHGGTFEIPILKVNNRQEDAKKVMRDAKDAVGINSKVAERLSGADFDGDTALVIPLASNNISVKSTRPLSALEGFDPKALYKLPDDAPYMKSKTKQNEMGRITNLITDMTVAGAGEDEICRAVKHSMVVIDAEKHHLDYKRSAKENGIQELKEDYQGVNERGQTKGASTILSKAGATVRIPKRNELTDTSKMTPEELDRWNSGKKVYRNSDETRMEQITNPKKMTSSELEIYNSGRKVYRQTDKPKLQKVSRMDTVDDAMDLVKDPSNLKEVAYANYANSLKELANTARRESRAIKPTPVNPTSKKTYASEVADLEAQLRLAEMNAPRERAAQVLANAKTREKVKSNPDMDYEHKQRTEALALISARAEVGAKKHQITISDKQWEAIQANAISTNKLKKILQNTDQEAFKKRATPRDSKGLSSAQISLIKSMSQSGMYTRKEIADALGVSTSTIANALD